MFKRIVSITSLAALVFTAFVPGAKALTYSEISKPQTGGKVLGATLLQAFTITESFGVSHPDQIIDFDYPNAGALNLGSTCMLGPDGSTQVPFQVLSTGKIAVRTSLSAGATKTWQLMTGCTPSAAPYSDQVTVDTSNPDYIQLSNSLTGARVYNAHGKTRTIGITSSSVASNVATITTAGSENDLETLNTDNSGGNYAWGGPLGTSNLTVTIAGVTGACSAVNGTWHINATDYYGPAHNQFKLSGFSGANCSDATGGTVAVTETDLAPVQGIQMKDGTWSPAGAKLINQNGGSVWWGVGLNANSVTTQIVENGPLETIVKVSYAYQPFQESIPSVNQNTTNACAIYNLSAPCTTPTRNGFYTSTIRLEAGQPSVLIEDDTNKDFYYQVNAYQQVQPDQGRYRAHHASTAALGYEPGQPSVTCTGALSSTPHDCYRDFDYSTPVVTNYQSSASTIAYSQAWNPWTFDTGWYWLLYNKSAAATAPVFGAFEGQAGRALGSNASGFSPYFLPDDGTGSRAAGFEFYTNRSGPDASWLPETRYSWGIYVGSKGDANFSNPSAIQNITLQQNLHGGFNLNKLYRYQLSFSDPSGGYGRLFNDPAMLQAIINKLRNGPDAVNYHNYLYSAESYARPLIDMWTDATGAKTHAAVVNANSLSTNMLNAYVNGMGIYSFDYHYWHGGLAMSNQLAVSDSALADPTLTAVDKAAIKADDSLYAYILYDEDFVPMNGFGGGATGNGLNAGTANMPIQQLGYRNMYTLFIPQHPFLSQYASAALAYADQAFQAGVSSNGASEASPHYTGAAAEPTMDSMLQGIMAGTNYFASDVPRATRFGELLMQFLTPPEVRYKITTSTYQPTAIPRKMVAEGDGSTEGTEMTGIAAQGFRNSNTSLAARLMGAWIAGGKVHSGFFATTLAIINENAAAADPKLASDNFPGYMSVLRSGWNTANENAAWLFNGDFLTETGHRHDDRGSAVIYALKAPLSVGWSSMYAAPTQSNMQSMVMPDANFGSVGWSGDNQLLTYASGWNKSGNDAFETFGSSSMANGKMANSNGLNWERKLYSITTDPNLPIIMVKDNFSGNNSTQGMVMNWNMMATSTVSTPAGPLLPTTRLYDSAVSYGTPNILPSTSAIIPLAAGVNQFKFTGQTWPQHPTGGIDWDLYTLSNESQQAVVGNWGHNWSPSTETSQYQAANGASYTEQQDLLRVHGTQGFWTLILPYDKGQRPADLAVTQDPTTKDAVVTYGGKIIKANEHYYSYADSAKTMLTSFDSSAVSGNGATISGGPMEISLAGSAATLTFSGSAGTRNFTLPGTWAASGGVTGSGSSFSYNFSGGNPVTVSLSGSAGAPGSPAIASFSASPASITSGGSSTLAWSVTGATSLSLNQGIGDVTSLTSKSVSPVATTAYTLTATNSSGSVSTSTTVTVSAPTDTTPPAISNISISNISSSAATISWTTDEPATSFVDFGLTTSYGTTAGTSVLVTSHTVTLANLSSASAYHFRVSSADSSGNLAVSSDNSFTTAQDPTLQSPPSAITNLSASQPTKTSMKLTWTAPGSSGNSGTASSYDIRYSTSPITSSNWASAIQVTGEPAPTLAGTTQSYVIVGLAQGTKYYSAITATNSQGLTSSLSNVVSFATKRNGK